MRLLIACRTCARRYRAAPEKIGKRFRCHCGEVLKVMQPKGHEASVVRCSACGGSRQKNARSCSYCGADFSLHERDLETVCPNCLARVSDRANYCPQCAERLTGEHVAGARIRTRCPACAEERSLASRRLGREKVHVLECQTCAGLWLDFSAFGALRDRVASGAVKRDDVLTGLIKPHQLREHSGRKYRHCIICEKLMTRRQYARRSGVVIDVCREHGIWFDPEELHQVLVWISEGGRTERPLQPYDEHHSAPSRSAAVSTPSDAEATTQAPGAATGAGFLDAIVSGLTQAFS